MTGSVARDVTDRVRRAKRRFFEVSDFRGSTQAVDRTLCRLVESGDLIRVRKGLYWKGPMTALGMAGPRRNEVLEHVLAGAAWGPASYTAANELGLSSQLPAVKAYAVTGRRPRDMSSVHFVQRSGRRGRGRLGYDEIALLEVLSDWDEYVEVPEGEVRFHLGRLVESGDLRPAALEQAARWEPRAVRDGLADLLPSLGV